MARRIKDSSLFEVPLTIWPCVLKRSTMQNAFFFLSTVLIWGSTWIAIAWQIGSVPVLVSVFYRFASAATILLLVLAATTAPSASRLA